MSDGLAFDLALDLPGFALRMAHALPGEGVTAVVGPSGAGKTTLLRALAGLAPAHGTITLGGDRLDTLPAHRRGVGVVFQEPRLFPHLDVAGNLRYGARRRGGTAGAIDGVVAALDLGPLLARRVAGLSGGEARRVALGRALASRPRLMLLDEPLSGLDAARKAEIVPYLASTLHRGGVPALLVTHAEDEALSLADRILEVDGGRIVAEKPGPPRLRAVVVAVAGGMARLDVEGSFLSLPLRTEPGARWALAIPEGGAILAERDPGATDALATLPVTLANVDAHRLRLSLGSQTVAWARKAGGGDVPEVGTSMLLIVSRVIARPILGPR